MMMTMVITEVNDDGNHASFDDGVDAADAHDNGDDGDDEDDCNAAGADVDAAANDDADDDYHADDAD